MTVRAIRYVALADGTSWAAADENGARWRCASFRDGKHTVRYADTWWEAWAMATEWKEAL